MITNREAVIGRPEDRVALDCIEAAIDAGQPKSVTNAEVRLEDNILVVSQSPLEFSSN